MVGKSCIFGVSVEFEFVLVVVFVVVVVFKSFVSFFKALCDCLGSCIALGLSSWVPAALS